MKEHRQQHKTIEIQHELFNDGGKSEKYRSLILGRPGFFRLAAYELVMLLVQDMPGALGLLLRSRLYRGLLGRVGKNVTFGKGVVIRHPHKIYIGSDVVIDDGCVLDAKGEDNHGISIGDGVYIGRQSILNCKNGDIILEDRVNISSHVTIFSASEVRIGEDELVAAYVYLVGGTHNFSDPTLPVLQQGRTSHGITVGPGGWIGAHSTVFDGVRIGRHAIIGAGSAVHRKIPDYAVAAGNPVTIINKRSVEEAAPEQPAVTVGVIAYNNKAVLKETIDSVRAQDYGMISEIILVDNCSPDGSAAFIRERYHDITVVSTDANRGPNPARNLALKSASTPLVLLMDGDIVLEKDTVTRLVEVMQAHPGNGIAGAQIRYYEDHSRIQYNGAFIHYAVGASMNTMIWGKPVQVEAIPGGTLLVDRRKSEEIGYYDEDFMFGWEDGDFSFRMSLAGYPCLIVPEAHVYHRQEKKGIRWIDYQVRNRWWFMLKNYRVRTIVVVLPAMLLNQIAMLFFFLFKGQLTPFARGSWQVLTSLPAVLRKRRAVNAIRRVRDRHVLSSRNIDLLGDADSSTAVRAAMRMMNGLYRMYWVLIRWIVN
ncbi:glycosyltransferase [bacterium]|nr:glycosyltransferase [bacterium]